MPVKTRISRIDPTRTTTLRKRLVMELRRRFARLKGDIIKLLVVDDVFDLKRLHLVRVVNVFCPTGEGGGVDPTCLSSDTIGAVSSHVADSSKTTDAEKTHLRKIILTTRTKRVHLERVFSTDPKWSTGEIVDIKPTSFTSIRVTKGHGAGHIGWKDTDEATASIKEPTRGLDVDYTKLLDKAGLVSPSEERETIVAGRYRVRVVKIPMPGTEKDSGWGNTKHYILEEIDDTVSNTTTNAPTPSPQDWRFKTSSEQVSAFQAWLRLRYNVHLVGDALLKWYAEEGYKRGIARAYGDVEKPFAKYGADESTSDFYRGSKEQFLRTAFGSPVGVERVKQLASRSFDDLNNVTSDMSARMSRSLLEGLVTGSHPLEIAKTLSKDLDISRGRAEMIARTEIIRAHAEGQLDAMESMGVQEVGVQVEWLTAGDEAVCPHCAAMEGVIIDIDKAHNLIPAHPNCRCAFAPAGDVLLPAPRSVDTTENAWRRVLNVFCATGEGGGVDPTCSATESAPTADTSVLLEFEHAVYDKLMTGYNTLEQPVKTAVAAALKPAFAGWTATQAIAEEVAKARGMSEPEAAKLRATLVAWDIGLFKPGSAVTAMDPTGIASAASWVIPPATGAYLAYSTARNPVKTAKAALKVVRDALAKVKAKLHGPGDFTTSNVMNTTEPRTDANKIADTLQAHGFDDWYVALLTSARSEGLGTDEAIELADTLYNDDGPPDDDDDEDDTDTDDVSNSGE